MPILLASRIEFDRTGGGSGTQKIVSTWNGSAYVAASTNKFLYDGWNLIAELNGANGIIRSYLWGLDLGGSMQGAGGVGGLLAIKPASGSPSLVAYDGNGNVTGLVDATTGTTSGQFEYGPFGETIRLTPNANNQSPFRFSTKYTDDESDFLYYGFRYYNANTGRWLSRDPIGEEAGPNLYRFVGNDSINKWDMFGLLEVWFEQNERRLVSGPMAGGEWSQPRGFGEGVWTQTDASNMSWIHLWSGPAAGGICNSIAGTLTYPDSPGDHKNTNPNAGAFSVLARDRCGGKFRLHFSIEMIVGAKGPEGNGLARVWQYGKPEKSISLKSNQYPYPNQLLFETDIDVYLDKKKKTVIQYTPTISFSTTMATRLRESEGWAYGRVELKGFDSL